jgi:hypothetical protein
MRKALVLIVLIGCSRRAQATTDAAAEAAAGDSAVAVRVDTVDPPKTMKKADGVSVIYVGGSGVRNTPPTQADPAGAKGGVVMAFQITNESDAELPINGQMSTQATTLAGLPGTFNDTPRFTKQCLGIVAPHGKFVCSVFYHFEEDPRELRVRVEGAWFNVAVEWRDAG